MSTAAHLRFLGRLAAQAARLGCLRVVVFTMVGFPYLLRLQQRAEQQPAAPKPENPFTYRLQ